MVDGAVEFIVFVCRNDGEELEDWCGERGFDRGGGDGNGREDNTWR
jgi:hypothetical protein